MKPLRNRSLLLALLVWLAAPAGAQTPAVIRPVVSHAAPKRAISNSAFQPGEKLEFAISYSGWLTAGYAYFSVGKQLSTHKGKSCYVIQGTGRSVPAFDWIYLVRDSFTTYVDAQRLVPHTYERIVHEGDYNFADKVSFDHEQRRIRTGKKGEFEMDGLTHDLLSAFYYARNLGLTNFTVGQSYEMPVFLDDKTYNLGMTVLGREVVETELGKFNCLKITPKLVTGRVFKEDGEPMLLWVTDDANYIPIKITSPLVVGSVQVRLIKYSGLRHPLTAKIEPEKKKK
ncbi:MAG: DUF3108 domain-containing protein [Bacteroidia bacterium]|nr:DUF3108 domain-containing protein [Bacteroidia bacterium]